MRVFYDQKSKDEYEQEKATFMSLWYYFGEDEEWFDKQVVDKYIRNKNNPHYENNRKFVQYKDISTTRVPTRCPKCRRAWAIEMTGSKFEPCILDPEVYNNIPMVKGECPSPIDDNCKEKE